MINLNKRLRDTVGAENVIDGEQGIRQYLHSFAVKPKALPRAIVLPRDSATIQRIVILANDLCVPITPVSSRIHLHQGADPVKGGIMVDLRHLNRILEIDRRNRKVRVEAGVTWGQLIPALMKENLMITNPLFPHRETSVVSSLLDRTPPLDPRFECAEPIASLELVWPTGELFRTGTASHVNYGASSAGGAYPYGPGPIDPLRLLQGSQGTMGIVTWANIRVKKRPTLNETILVPLDSPQHVTALMHAVQKRRIGRECFALNAAMLKTTICEALDLPKAFIDKRLPQWLFVLVISAAKWFPEEKIAYEKEALRKVMDSEGLTVDCMNSDKQLFGLGPLHHILRSPWPDPKAHWTLNGTIPHKRLFFISRLDKAPAFIRNMEQEAAGAKRISLGVYVQPLEYGGGTHLEFAFFTPNQHDHEADEIFWACAISSIKLGAHYTRPQGRRLARLVYGRLDPQYIRLLKETKPSFDPNFIMNPDKLCFSFEDKGNNGSS